MKKQYARGVPQELIDQALTFHRHWCPGLVLGIRAAAYALQELGAAGDEEIVAVTETDMCAVDAVQALTGCTFGKGNLVFKDRGKVAFSFSAEATENNSGLWQKSVTTIHSSA